MYLLIQYPAGVVVEGMVLARKRSRLRVVARGFADVIELKRSGPNWTVDGHQSVELDFLMSTPCDTPNTEVPAMQFAHAN
jgi:hypothetical protein